MKIGRIQTFPETPFQPQVGTILIREGDVVTFARSGGPNIGRTPKVGDAVSLVLWRAPSGELIATSWWYLPEGIPASWKTRALVDKDKAQYVRSNLQQFGLPDLQVVGKRWIENEAADERFVLETEPMSLSELCGNCPEVQYAPGYRVAGYSTTVFDLEGAIIGFIDSDRRLCYNAAPDIRTCVGWSAATDLGRTQHLVFNVDEAAKRVVEAMSWCPELRDGGKALNEFFFGDFMTAVKEAIPRNSGSRFEDGGAAITPLWRVATRTLKGAEHPGFPYFS